MVQDKQLTHAQQEILRVASHHEQISQSRLAASPGTLDVLIRYGYLDRIEVRYSEPYYRITEAGKVALQERGQA